MALQTKAESVLLIPVPEAAPLVHQHRLRYDPAAPAGVPEHITILYPFLAPAMLDDAVVARLRAIFSAVSPISCTLRRTAWFEQGVLYLAPEPEAPFVALTHQLSDACGVLPFEGQYPEVIPHLTIAQHGPKDILSRIAADTCPLMSWPRRHGSWSGTTKLAGYCVKGSPLQAPDCSGHRRQHYC